MTAAEIIAKIPATAYPPQYYDTIPAPLISFMKEYERPFRDIDSWFQPVSYYLADISTETDPFGNTLWLYDASRQDFCVDQHTGDVICAACLNHATVPDDQFGVTWHAEEGYDTIHCSTCHDVIYSPLE